MSKLFKEIKGSIEIKRSKTPNPIVLKAFDSLVELNKGNHFKIPITELKDYTTHTIVYGLRKMVNEEKNPMSFRTCLYKDEDKNVTHIGVERLD